MVGFVVHVVQLAISLPERRTLFAGFFRRNQRESKPHLIRPLTPPVDVILGSGSLQIGDCAGAGEFNILIAMPSVPHPLPDQIFRHSCFAQHFRTEATEHPEHLAKRCANTNCVDPLFVGERVDQRDCGRKCKEVGRLATKKEWWSKNRARR